MKYRFVDHTADIAFEVYGSDLKELFENAALAFYDAFVDTSKLKTEREAEVECEGEDVEITLYRWLNELLYLFDTEFFAAKTVRVEIEKGSAIKARGKLGGGKFNAEMVKVEPKAITLHKFRVEKTDNGYLAFVVVDI
uniref:Protein archease n=2 Tax=Archaeoglobus fulgidus TaxID=2234 RepID=A0A7C2SEY2_ARCFL